MRYYSASAIVTSPSENGSSVCSSNCYANPEGRPEVHDENTAAITLAACQKPSRVQATGSRAQDFIRRHARVSRGTATPARASPIAALCRRVTPRSAKSELNSFGRRAFA